MFPVAEFGLTILRVVAGLIFVAHGAQKLFGWFGGHGVSGTAGFFGQLGLRPARFWAVVAGLAEFFGGLCLVLGLLTPFAAAAVASSMLGAIVLVHLPKGFWNTSGGYEFNLALLAAAVCLGLAGPGAYALDPFIALPVRELDAFLGSLVVGIVGLIVAYGTRAQPAAQPRDQQTRQAAA